MSCPFGVDCKEDKNCKYYDESNNLYKICNKCDFTKKLVTVEIDDTFKIKQCEHKAEDILNFCINKCTIIQYDIQENVKKEQYEAAAILDKRIKFLEPEIVVVKNLFEDFKKSVEKQRFEESAKIKSLMMNISKKFI